MEAKSIDIRGALKSLESSEFAKRAVDFPLQHGGASSRAAKAGALPIYQAHFATEPGKVMGHKSTRYSGADHEHVARETTLEISAHGRLETAEPW